MKLLVKNFHGRAKGGCIAPWPLPKYATGGDGSVRVASMAPKYGNLRGYLRRVLKNLMTLTSRYSVAF